MKQRTKKLIIFALVGLLVLSTVPMASAASVSKNIEAWFSGIKIIANGKTVVSNLEPFIYNGSTYVPVRMAAEALGKQVDWNSASNSVIITDGPADTATTQEITQLRALLSMKDAEIARLEKQLDELESKKDAADDLESYLIDEYEEWEDIEFDFSVKGDEDELELTIEVDLGDYSREWSRLDEDDIEDWLEDICDYVEDEYPDADFSGTIEDIDEDETLVEFSVSSSGRLSADFLSSVDFDQLEEDLEDYYGYDLDYEYDDDFGSMEAYFTVDGDEDDEEVNVTVYVDYDEYKDEWDAIANTSVGEDWIEDIVDYILDECEDYTIDGEILDDNTDDVLATFGTTRSGSIWIDWE
jgi:hypothetical protein